MLNRIRIVLVNTTHTGNIGATARAMKTMGLSDLWLVNPSKFPSAEATARASGADNVLGNAHVVDTLDEALAGAGWVLGTSARLRSLSWPALSVDEAAQKALQEASAHPVAILFGRERYGLTNDELKRCHYLVQIPADPVFSSLNLAAAVQIVAYELYRQLAQSGQSGEIAPQSRAHDPAHAEHLEGFHLHLEKLLRRIGFLRGPSEKMLLRLRRLFNRARPDATEINILRGILSDVERRLGLYRRQASAHKKHSLRDREAAQQHQHPHGRADKPED